MPSVLFICTGNTCRSPMAAALFTAQLEKHGAKRSTWRIDSAGINAAEDQPATPQAVQVLAQRGITQYSHHSKQVNGTLLSQFNLVLCMETRHQEKLFDTYPQFKDRIFLLSQMSDQTVEIPDPYGGSVEDYELTARSLQQWITDGFDLIQKKASSPR